MDRSTKRRRWEEMDQDCLACIFIKVGIESLLLFVPLVCKSWYQATRNPVCYERLTFPDPTADDGVDPWSVDEKLTSRLPKYFNSESARFDFFIRKFAREFRIDWTDFTILKFMKLVVGRSGGSVKFLKLPGLASHYMNAIHGILELVSNDCKKFTGFQVTDGNIGKSAVEAMVKFCPNLKHLSLRKSTIVKSNLVTILEGCRNLEVLDVRNCEGFEAEDEEILKLAAHIPKFMCRGSKLFARKNSRLRVVVIGVE